MRPQNRRWLSRLLGAHYFIDRTSLAAEPELAHKRWPAYYHLDPIAANLRFARDYQLAFRAQFRRDVDLHWAERVQGINLARIMFPNDPTALPTAEFTAVNSVRQHADAIGLPYETFISFCMRFASNRGVTHIPRPNQLIPSPSSRFRAAWERALKKYRPDFKEAMISKYREDLARGRVGYPGCLGVPGAYSTTSAPCSGCALAAKCVKIAAAIEAKAAQKSQEMGAPLPYGIKLALHQLDKEAEKRNRQRDRDRTGARQRYADKIWREEGRRVRRNKDLATMTLDERAAYDRNAARIRKRRSRARKKELATPPSVPAGAT